MPHLKTVHDVVDCGLCVGCGACSAYAGKTLRDVTVSGIRPVRPDNRAMATTDGLAVCPGHWVGADVPTAGTADHPLLGPVLEVWQGHATDETVRHRASSGGLLTALSSFCIEREGMSFVLHSAMDPEKPWLNRTVHSTSRAELVERSGSRYAPSSPCEGLRQIEEADRPAVFVGKPCDVAAVSKARRLSARLDRNLGLVLTFFCAGTPSTAGTKALLARQNIPLERLGILRYRGEGWPGRFKATDPDKREFPGSLSYRDSWGFLQKYRPFRCQLCPDGTGQFADISCGDAWHLDQDCDNPGSSLAIVRTLRGQKILRAAMEAGYIVLTRATTDDVLKAQSGLLDKRRQLFGRLLAFRLLGLPAPTYKGFHLYTLWRRLPVRTQMRTVLGTWKRIVTKGLWRRQDRSWESDNAG